MADTRENRPMHGALGQLKTEPEALARPDRKAAEDAVRTLIRWAGEDPDREGLLDTPGRVTRAYAEWFEGYEQDPGEILTRTFDEVGGYDGMVVLRDIPFESCCEHHLARISGVVHVGYLPRDRVVGISKISRVVEAYARRMQVQERLTAQIADTIQEALGARGVGVTVEASHACMSTRGVRKHGVSMVTSRLLGTFREDPAVRQEFMASIS